MTSLSSNEIAVLSALKDGKEKSVKEIDSQAKIGEDGARRGIFFLSQKGLAEMKVKERKSLILTEKGKSSLSSLPDLKLLSCGGKGIKEIEKEILPFLGPMKSFNFISVENGIIRVLAKDQSKYPILIGLKSPEKADKPILDELKKRGYIEEKESKDISARITKQGMELKISSGPELKEITSEIIKSGKTKFAKLNIVPETVEPAPSGKLHPISTAIDRIKDIFVSMGFEEMEGNYIEEAFWNFDALFQPQDHPSRELADTFYIKGRSDLKDTPKDMIERAKAVHDHGWKGSWDIEEAQKLILRTHTTVLSARTLAKRKKGKFFAIGRVFRNEAIDFKHLAEFHQVEGIIADESVNFRQLLGILKTFYARMGFKKVKFVPSYFPYTEPSLEVHVFFEPRQEWIELGGAGIFRPEVCDILGCTYPVLAFGLSLERPLMMILETNDIRAFYNNDVDFLKSVKREFIGEKE
ncbi:MAG: phenylalanine--tRNA ligase subunit alpha [Candidatus Micrarchaeota archaeon]|nr:phenylalanine--tRNA ligase subunit alpha [Candidatus Micrarchaeota archaeon]